MVSAAALVAVSSGASTPSVVETRSCSQAGPFFNVQIAGNIDSTYWGRIHRELFARIPRGEAMVAVWTFGSQQNKESDLYGFATSGRSDLAARCRSVRAMAPTTGALRASFRVKDGWALGRRYECNRRGRVAIQTDVRGGRTRLSVWMASTRELIAVAEIARGVASIRASKRCEERSL
jgi:hypothetical protein